MELELPLDDAADAQDEINRRVYHARGADKTYQRTALHRAEVIALLKYQPCFAQRDMLDVGVGAGRTTIYMAPLAHRYEAIDYSPVMVQAMQRLWPQVSTRLVDMRRLAPFDDGAFDFVLASNNVFDAVSHQDRLRTLAEVRRVLRPGGVLMFSAHNRALLPALRRPRLAWSRNPINLARHALTWLRQWRHHRGLQGLHAEHADHALYSDEGHDFACLHYYIDPAAQRQQLHQAGFRPMETMDIEGRTLDAGDMAPRSPWLLYVAQSVA